MMNVNVCRHDASTPVAALCEACQRQRNTFRNRPSVRRSRPPAQRAGTVTIQPKFTRGILRLTDQLTAALNANDPVATARTARRLLAALRHPLALAREELVEEDRPPFRRSRRN